MKRIVLSVAIFLVAFAGSYTFSKWLFGDEPTQRAAEAPQTSDQRRLRTGPRKPPPALPASTDPQPSANDVADAVENDPTPNTTSNDTGDPLSPQEEKLQEYLEHLDAIEDPNVDELTMLGEMAFYANQPDAAYEHYLEVIDEHTDHPQAPFALYKLAWTEYNLGDVDAAIDDMELMLEWLDYGEDSPLEQTLREAGPADLERFRSAAD